MIQFTYRLEGAGWAEATVSDGQTCVSIPASYICDALGYLVAAVQSLFTSDSAEWAWQLEPGLVKWKFRRQQEWLTVEVQWFDEVRVAPDRFEWRLELDRVAFVGKSDVLYFALQLDRQLQKTLDQWGLDGYEQEWDHPFPVAARERLQSHITTESQRRLAAGKPST